MQKLMLVVCAAAGLATYATLAISAEHLAAAVKERRHLMKEIVAPAAKLANKMVKGDEPFDAAKAAKAMTDISEVPDKYVKLFPKGTEHGAIADSEAKAVKVSDNDPIEIPPAPGVATPGGQTKEQIHDFDLALISDRSIYKVNDLPIFTIVSSESCHLTLINVDASGEGTVIFPNKFQQDNLLPAGKALQFPASDAKFPFRLKDPGTETVVAICNATGTEADGIKHDFKTRQFTELGNYRDFLTRQIVVEGAEKIAAARLGQQGVSGEGAPGTPKSDILSRAAIKLTVK
jgi:Domain of unknown function (DUF4384)/Cytochrome C'